MQTWVAWAGIEFAVLLFVTWYLLRHYAVRTISWLAWVTVFISWYLGFFGTLFLPIDIAEAYASTYTNITNVTEIEYEPNGGNGSSRANGTLLVTAGHRRQLAASYGHVPGRRHGVEPLGIDGAAAHVASAIAEYGQQLAALFGGAAGEQEGVPAPGAGSSGTGSGVTVTVTAADVDEAAAAFDQQHAAVRGSHHQQQAAGAVSSARRLQATPSASAHPTSLPTRLPSKSPAATRTPTPSRTPSRSVTPSGTPSVSGTPSATPSFGSSPSPTPSVSPTPPAYPPATGNDTGNGTVTWEIVEEEVQIRNGPLETMWKLVYWSTFLLTYIIIPVVQEYVAAGEFKPWGRFKTSVRVNLLFYLAIGIVGALALGYVIFFTSFDLWTLPPLLISIANTYGLVLIVLLMGYGAAEVPRAVWRRGDPEGELRRLQFQASEVEGSFFDAKRALESVVAHVKKLRDQVMAMGQETDNQTGAGAAAYADLRRCMDIVLSKCAAEIASGSIGSSVAVTTAEMEKADAKLAEKAKKKGWGRTKVGMKKLAALHKQLMAARAIYNKQRFRWDRHVIRATILDYIVRREVPPAPVLKGRQERSASRYWGTTSTPMVEDDPNGAAAGGGGGGSQLGQQALSALAFFPNLLGGAVNRVMWNGSIFVFPHVYRFAAVIAEVMSLLLMWSEATIWVNLQGLVKTNLSVFGLLLTAADTYGYHSYLGIQIAAAIPLAWMCICSSFALFKIKFFHILDLSGGRNTDPYSLCVNAALFNRLQFALAFNYLNVLMHSNNKKDYPDTAFTHSVGANMKLSIVDWYLPMIMVVVYILCRINMFERLLRLLGVDEKGSPVRGKPEHEEAIADGAKLIAAARKKLGLLPGSAASGSDGHGAAEAGAAAGGGSWWGGKKGGADASGGGAGIEMRGGAHGAAPPAAADYGPSRFKTLDTFAATAAPGAAPGGGRGGGGLAASTAAAAGGDDGASWSAAAPAPLWRPAFSDTPSFSATSTGTAGGGRGGGAAAGTATGGGWAGGFSGATSWLSGGGGSSSSSATAYTPAPTAAPAATSFGFGSAAAAPAAPALGGGRGGGASAGAPTSYASPARPKATGGAGGALSSGSGGPGGFAAFTSPGISTTSSPGGDASGGGLGGGAGGGTSLASLLKKGKRTGGGM